MYVAKPIEWTDEGVVMLDQRLLPTEEVSYTFTTYQDVAKAIKDMVIRGAPAIGVAAAMGVAIGVQGGLFSNEHNGAAGAAFVGVMAGVTAAGYALGNAADRRITTIQIIH